MRIGIGLPNPAPGVPGQRLVDWGVRAEEAGFSGLATIDRIVYPSHDSLVTLAAVAGATTKITLLTNILVAPAYPPALLAKQAATLHGVSGGRFTLGMGVGGRPDDFEAAGQDFHTRGRRLDEALELMQTAWAGHAVDGYAHPLASPIAKGVPVLVGGTSDRAIARAVRFGVGWTSGGAPPEVAGPVAAKVSSAWRATGREGKPRLAAMTYFSLGDDVAGESREYLRGYYAFLGDRAEMIADGARRSDSSVVAAVAGFDEAGFDELYFVPTSTSLSQIERLADLIL